MSELPAGWADANLLDLCDPKQWKVISSAELTDTGYVVYGANGKIGFYSTYTHEDPTLMITCRGATCGNLHVSEPKSYINGNAMALDNLAEQATSVRYLKYALLARGLGDVITGSAQPQITRQSLSEVAVRLAPLAEQTRIAQKLDELLAQVDTLKARIDGIPALLKRFRQSVLAAAVSGRLTEDWRVARMKSGEVDAPDAINFQKLSDICLSITDGDHQAPPQSDTGIPFITISAINDGVIRLEKATRYVPDSYYSELKESRKPQTGDILFSVTGSICIPAMVLNEAPFTFQRHIAILRPNTALALQKFMYFYLGSEQIKKQGLDVATGTAQLTVPLKGLRNFDISLPSLAEQTEIVRRVEQLFAFADQLAAKVASAKSRIDHLTQSILAKAFRGELVPQDPNDEPASVLLERIKTQRAAAPKAKRGRKSA